MRSGRKSEAQTPSPKKDRIKGSKVNPKGSASSTKSAKSIELSDSITTTLENKRDEYNAKHPNKKVTLATLKAVFRRGAGAFSSSHRPNMTRSGWAFARVNKFLLKKGGTKVKAAYVQDDDLMENGGLTDSLGMDMGNLKRNGIVLKDNNETITLIAYNTGNQESKPSLYNKSLIYSSVKPIKSANEIIQNFDLQDFENFSESKIEDYKKSHLIIMNENEVVYDSKNLNIRFEDGGKIKKDKFDFSNSSIVLKKTKEEEFIYNNIEVPSQEIIYWLYDVPNSQKKVDDGIFDELQFGEGINTIWEKEYQRKHKGSENLIGVAKIRLNKNKTKIYILTMTTKPSLRRMGIMSYLISKIREEYNIDKNDVLFVGLTSQGQKFYSRKKYNYGGDLGQEITCRRCLWTWNTNNSDEHDKYVCHKCGFDNRTFYDSDPIGMYVEGGVFDEYNNSRIKKVYVSIRINNKTNRTKDFKYEIESSDDKVFQELQNHKLLGVSGVSSSRYNVADWLSSRDCLILMNFNDFIKENDAEQIHYEDASYLTQNGLDIMFRIYNRKGKDDESYFSVLQNLFPKIALQFQLEAQLYSDSRGGQYYFLEHIFNVYNSSKFIRYFAKQPRVSSVKDFVDIAIQYIESGDAQVDYPYQRQPESIDYQNITNVIDRGIVTAIKVYRDESEWILKDKELNVPNGSQLIFVLSSYENMKDVYENMIDKYRLRESYKINYVDFQNVSKFQQNKFKTQEVEYKENIQIKKKRVDVKIKNILKNVLDTIIQKIEDRFVLEMVDYNPPPYYDYDDTSIDYGENPLSIPKIYELFINTISKLIELYDSEIDNIVSSKHYWTFVQIFYKYEEYVRNLRDESYQNEDIVVAYDQNQNRVYLSSFYDTYYRTIKYFDYREFIKDIKIEIGSDLYNAYTKEEINFKKGGELKKPHTIIEIAEKHNIKVSEVVEALIKGQKMEREHTNDDKIAKTIAQHHLWESPKYYEKLKEMEETFEDGGIFVLDEIALPDTYANIETLKRVLENQGYEIVKSVKNKDIFETGGMVVGKSHQEADENGTGEKFKLKSTGQVVELEGGEAVIVGSAIDSEDTISFNGEEKTPREIASYLNHAYGGVKFEKGGHITCGCSHKKYYHGGELPSAVVNSLNGGEAVITKKTMESQDKYEYEGERLTPRQILSRINHRYGGVSFAKGGKLTKFTNNPINIASKMIYFVNNIIYA